MADFNLAYAPVAKWEGGWTHDSGDKGGETFRGCARNFFPNEPIWPVIDREKSHPSYKKGKAAFSAHLMGIPSLTGCVKGWYKKEWWDKLGLERFDQIVADELFEQAVNLGKAGMGRYLQRLCNAFNWRKDGSADGARLFDDLQTDGVVGPKTLSALSIVLSRNDARRIVHLMNCMQGAHYVNSAANRFRRSSDGFRYIDGFSVRHRRVGHGRRFRRLRVHLRVHARAHGTVGHVVPDCLRAAELDRLQQGQSQKRRRRGQWRQVMHGRPSSASFNWFLKVFGNTAAVPVWALCALTAALHGCGSSGALTSVPPAPMTPGAIITEAWAYEEGGRWKQVEGEWIHLPANEGAELLLWIEHAEELCR